MNTGPELLSEILARLFAARGWGRRQARLRLEEAWRQAAGEAAAKHSRPGTLRHGVLEVIVRDPIVLQELAHFQKRRLLETLQARLVGTRLVDLRFRLGMFEEK